MSVAVDDPTPLRGDLDQKQCMETLQEAYLHAVAAAARCPPCHADVRQPVYQGILFLDGPEESTSA
ncbi:hypothetical protein D0Q02_27880 [Micromonospora craniellae]|uniref:Uncharacterized protein n=1 Tax=Micromonospora craniellae TaxID=2294034 RepID=A0A372FRK7_9ACTN|nr:hypothetical protein D0Q02_27880 [Micromonospora craniellae]